MCERGGSQRRGGGPGVAPIGHKAVECALQRHAAQVRHATVARQQRHVVPEHVLQAGAPWRAGCTARVGASYPPLPCTAEQTHDPTIWRRELACTRSPVRNFKAAQAAYAHALACCCGLNQGLHGQWARNCIYGIASLGQPQSTRCRQQPRTMEKGPAAPTALHLSGGGGTRSGQHAARSRSSGDGACWRASGGPHSPWPSERRPLRRKLLVAEKILKEGCSRTAAAYAGD